MREFGFVTPDWYLTLKRDTEPLVNDPEQLHALAVAAGWSRIEVTVQDVATGLVEPADLVDWRWGMAHLAPFVGSLPAGRRRAARDASESAVVAAGELVVPLAILACS